MSEEELFLHGMKVVADLWLLASSEERDVIRKAHRSGDSKVVAAVFRRINARKEKPHEWIPKKGGE